MASVHADRTICMGYGVCVINFPEVFELDESRTVVITRAISDEEVDLVEVAVNSCPTGALTLEE